MTRLKQTAQLTFASFAVLMTAAAQVNAISISVDVNANRKAINPLIYGIAFGSATDVATLNSPMNRWGGNGTSRYNWQLNASSHASDWYFESIANASAVASADADQFINDSRNNGATPAMTIGMIPWTAKLGTGRATLGSFSIAKYGPQTGSEGDHGNGISTATGNPYITGNDPNDANTPNSTAFELGWMQHMTSTFGTASAGGVKYYIMDNETALWNSTHRDVHPTGAHGTEIAGDIESYAATVKGNDAGALVQAPEEWGWTGFLYTGYDAQWAGTNGWTNTPDRVSFGGLDYMPWLLQTLKAYDTAHGTKSIDVFSLHWYPQSGEYGNDDSAAMQLNRNKSTRSLWDPAYTDISWIATQVQLIPRMKGWVSTYYPGLTTAITEYNWGDEGAMNGATTQADIYGIFGREGLDEATRWTVPANTTPTYFAMKLFRNYDGGKSTFGDTSVSCTAPNADQQSAFAAQRTSDNALTVMAINKITTATASTITIANFTGAATAQRWQVTGAAITHLSDITVTGGNTISDTLPAQSVTLYVLAKAGVTIPPAPAGLTATPGNGQVALAWNSSSGATTYNVLRSTVNGSGYANVVSQAGTSYTNTGLTNGTTYYFVVTATNSAGTSGNSNQASAMPSGAPAPPTGLTATAGNAQVALSWTASSGATTYNVLRSTVNGSGYTNVVSQAGTSYTNTGLTNGTTYYFVVTATNANGTSGNSNQASAMPIAAPPAPTGLTAGSGNTEVPLYWTASAGATGYNVLRSTVNGSGYAAVSSLAGTNYTNTGLTNGTTYYFVVTASNSVGTSGNSNQASATPAAAPQAQIPNTATAPTIDGNVDAAWSAATSYNITNVSGTVSSAADLSASWQGLWDATNLYILVSVTDDVKVNDSVNPWDDDAVELYLDANHTGGTTYTANDRQIVCGWGDAAPVEGGGRAIAGVVFGKADPTGTSYRIEAKIPWAVEAFTPAANAIIGIDVHVDDDDDGGARDGKIMWNDSTDGAWGNPSLFGAAKLTAAGGPPPAPTSLTATAGNTQVALAWTASSGATSYNVLRSTVSGSGYASVATGVATTSYTNTGLTNGTTYYFVVTATNANGTSGNSNQASATPQPPVPAVPTGLIATPGNAQVALSWTASSGATAYDVKRSTVSGSGYATVSSPTVTNYTNTGLTNGTTYYFVVDAKNGGGTSANSSQVSATPSAGSPPPAPTGVSAIASDAQIALTWNASTGATSYNVKRSTINGSGYATVSSPTVTNYTNTGLTDGTTYYYVVTAVSAIGESGNSSQVSGLPAQYNFESGAQGWSFTAAPITGVAQSVTQAFGPTHSLAVTINGAAANTDAFIASPTTPAGKVVTYRVWIPAGAQLSAIQPYVLQGAGGGWLWTGNIVPIASLTTNAWNTVQVTVPANAAMPLYQLGVEFRVSATWSGTCYIDSISW